MELPKILYVNSISETQNGLNVFCTDFENGVKYIRADFAEMTWKDVQLLHNIIADIAIDGDECLGLTGNAFWEKLYTEALRRFNSIKEERK
jgi:hypothetical protein